MPDMLPIEFRLAATCAWFDRQCWLEQREAVRALLDAGTDPESFLDLVRRHRIPVLAHAVLSQVSRETSYPIPWLPLLAEDARRARMRSLALHAEWQRLQALFQTAGIPVYALKGTLLSERLYGDIGMRHVRDIDLLVAPESVTQACSLLQESGYAVRQFFPDGDGVARRLGRLIAWHIECNSGSTKVELHWRFERLCRSTLDAQWLDHLRRHHRNGATQFDLLYCCLHGSSHGWSRLKWLGDVRVLVGRLLPHEWTELLASARELRMETLLAQTLVLLHRVFGFPPPEQAQSLMRQHARLSAELAEDALEWLMLPELEIGSERVASKFRSRRLEWSLGHRHAARERAFHSMCIALFSPVDMERWRLPAWLLPLYPLLRPLSLLGRVLSH